MNPLSLLAGPYGLLIKIGGVLLSLVVFYVYAQHRQHVADQIVFDAFVSKVNAAGEKAKAETVIKTAEGVANKKEADNENIQTRTVVVTRIKRVRDANPSSSFVPPAPADASRPELICFDRAEYSGADGRFTEGARGLADEGTTATIDLDTAKKWARSTPAK